MLVLKYPIAKVSICFVTGILVAVYFPLGRASIVTITAFALATFIITYFATLHKAYSPYFAASFVGAAFSLGMLAQEMHNLKQDPSHFSQKQSVFSKSNQLQIVLLQRLKPTAYSERYIGKIQKIDEENSKGKILINFANNEENHLLSVGSVFRVSTVIQAQKPPLNPDSFDYGKYLATKGIHGQVTIDASTIELRNVPHRNLRYYADQIRLHIIQNLSKHGFPPAEIPIISALFLGQQQDISASVLRDYQLAGAVHILSVSGLHVGFILVFINFLMRPLPKNNSGNLVRLLVTITLLWTFAVIAGLSPSVVRSVTMFSFVAWGLLLRRQTNIYYILLLSIFVILLVEPAFVFDVGFQLSYTTLFFIIWLQPKLKRIWNPRHKILAYLNGILSVSVAAQIGALPLSIYYFHQFPGLFFITNLLIIPALTIIMILGIAVLVLAAFDYVPLYPMKLLSEGVKIINYVINKIASEEQFIISNIPFNKMLLSTFYLLIISIALFNYKRNFNRITLVLIAIISVQTALILTKKNSQSSSEFVIFHKTAETILSSRSGKNVVVYSSDTVASKVLENSAIKGYLVNNFIKKPQIKSVSNVFTFRDKRILLIDSAAVHPKNATVDVLILTQSAKINFERLLIDLHPKIVVADGSNYKTQVRRWEETALKQKIPFHKTSEEGFFRVK